MSVEEKLKSLENMIGYKVRQDIYRGSDEKHIVYVYEDERPELSADNEEQLTTVYVRVTLYTPENYDYHADKKAIKKELKRQGFSVSSIRSWLEVTSNAAKSVRHTDFAVTITESEE